jgi:cytochrome b6-f complex iron-sulfur subunit
MDTPEKKGEEKQGLMSRRYFLELVGIGSIAVTAAGSAILTVEYLSPNVLLEPSPTFKAGPVDEYTPNSVTKMKEEKVYIVRAKEGFFYAISDVCTHLGCITNWLPDEHIIACPCHGSRFDMEGNVVHGPAPRPLLRYAITLNEKGQLVVDKAQIVDENAILKV